jgi:hypothetical protein
MKGGEQKSDHNPGCHRRGLLSLFGLFAEIIAFILPWKGYFGILILIGMTVNYVRIRKADGKEIIKQK